MTSMTNLWADTNLLLAAVACAWVCLSSAGTPRAPASEPLH